MMSEINRIRIGLQKSGRLTEPSFDLMHQCGIKLTKSRDKLLCMGENFPVDILLVRDDDIPSMVMDGICDLGIVGTNVLREKSLQRLQQEKQHGFTTVAHLDFGRCHLGLAVPNHSSFQSAQDLAGKKIATSYPHLLTEYLSGLGIAAEIHLLSGSVEIAPRLKIADAICDLVSTGGTLAANGLREIETIFKSEAVLIQTNHTMNTEKDLLLKKILRRIDGVRQVNGSKYVMMHAPKAAVHAITQLLPGVEHPSIVPLDGEDERVAIHAVCKETDFWETMEELKSLGASAILVLPVEKMLL